MKYHADLDKLHYGTYISRVSIDCDDWDLYERLVKIIEKELQ